MKRLLTFLLLPILLLPACSPSLPAPAGTPVSVYQSAPATAALDPADILASEILGRPTDTAITISVIPAAAMELYYEYGTASGVYTAASAIQTARAGEALETLLTGLQPGTRYYYRLRAGAAAGEEHSFTTQRLPGSTFTFAVQADSHLNTDQHCNPELYRLTMENIAAAGPDFFIDLGDTFRTDKLHEITAENIDQLYQDQRQFFGLVAHSAPLYLVNGNHEMEWGWLLDGSPDNPAVWSGQARNRFYPQPAPDGFYTGDPITVEPIGLLRDYYAWSWGDALFVVIDPYWSTTTDPKRSGDNWDWTLGEAQYRWFRQTLETSPAAYKFVFTHHVLGETRGGVEMAPFFEWGGYDRNGSWAFDEHRPGWGQPIQQVMALNGVTIFFQGHDHLYARQELDGVVYQTVPMPADDSYQTPNADAYLTGTSLPESGYLRVTVAPQGVTVDYIRSFLPEDEDAARQNGMLEASYTLAAP